MTPHQRIWTKHFGKIPTDEDGRSYEIHHKDGNRKNNDINNLQLVSIQEHLEIHKHQGDWGACALIAKRMGLPPSYGSDIQRGKKRPGIGGAPKGRIPWNKGVKGYKLNCDRRGRRFSPTKLTIADAIAIRQKYTSKFVYDLYQQELVDRKQRKQYGKPLPYSRFLAKYLQSTNYPFVTSAAIYATIVEKTWKNV